MKTTLDVQVFEWTPRSTVNVMIGDNEMSIDTNTLSDEDMLNLLENFCIQSLIAADKKHLANRLMLGIQPPQPLP